MALKKQKPTTPSRRGTILVDRSELSKEPARKSLLKRVPYKAARSGGKITVRHKGGRTKRKFRIIDFKRDKRNIEGIVEALEYDPNRSSNLALIKYIDGERRYILSPLDLKVGDKIVSGDDVPLKIGNATMLKQIPTGIKVHSIELYKGKGAQLCRSAWM